MRHDEQQPGAAGLRINEPRAGRVLAGGTSGLARLLSLGDEAMVIATRLQPHLGEQVTVDLSDECSLTGTVIWTQPGECGLCLAAPIDSAALLQRLAPKRAGERTAGEHRRRRPSDTPVVMLSELGQQIVRLRDLTPGGARIVHDGRFQPGMAVKLQIAPGIERPGILSWSRDGIAGVVLGDAMDGDPQGAVTRM